MSYDSLKNEGGMPMIRITHNDGAFADVQLQGAHLTQWTVASTGRSPIFMSSAAVYQPGKALRGGVPICWPQFSDMGPIPSAHGYARVASWEFCGIVQSSSESGTTASFALNQPPDAPEPFRSAEVKYFVTVGGPSLSLRLEVTNGAAEDTLSFTTALHTYFRVSDIADLHISGVLDTLEYADNLDGRKKKRVASVHGINGEVDRIYFGSNGQNIRLTDAKGVVRIAADGLNDTVLWNPWVEKTKRLPDLEADAYKHFVCVESGAVANAVKLSPGEKWSGAQLLTLE